MTREEILAMEAGIELDTVIHSEIMGRGSPSFLKPLPKYSTDIKDAWQVVEKDGAWDIKKRFRPHPGDPPMSGGRATYQATVFLSDYDPYEDELINKRNGKSPWCWSLPEAICKAALITKINSLRNEGRYDHRLQMP